MLLREADLTGTTGDFTLVTAFPLSFMRLPVQRWLQSASGRLRHTHVISTALAPPRRLCLCLISSMKPPVQQSSTWTANFGRRWSRRVAVT